MQTQIPHQTLVESGENAASARIKGQRPTGVTVVSWILIIVSVLGLLTTFLAATSPDYNAMLAKNRLPVPMQKVLAALGMLAAFVSALFMRTGAAWARWLYVGCGVFGVMGVFANLGFTGLILPSLLLYTLSIVVLFRRASSEFFGGEGPVLVGSGASRRRPVWPGTTYALAAFCLAVGLVFGYSFWGGAKPGGEALPTRSQSTAAIPTDGGARATRHPLSPQERATLDRTAAPLLDIVAKNPDDFDANVKLGNLYYDTQQHPDAIYYYERALKIHPDDPDVRTDLGTAYLRIGDADRAIAEYQTSLSYKPDHSAALYNLGIVRWQAKRDAAGAVAAWEELLRRNPNSPDRQMVEELMATVGRERKRK